MRKIPVRESQVRQEISAPAYTAIGDRQYHHFTVNVPKKCKSLVVSLKGYEGRDDFDLTLSADPRKLAFKEDAKFVSDEQGCTKTLTIKKPKPGKMFISVFCNTTVTSTDGTYGTEYSGRTDVLNGVPYAITVE